MRRHNYSLITPNTSSKTWIPDLLNAGERYASFVLVKPDFHVLSVIMNAPHKDYLWLDPQGRGMYGVGLKHYQEGDCATTVAYRMGSICNSNHLVVVIPKVPDNDCLAAIAILLGAIALPHKVKAIQTNQCPLSIPASLPPQKQIDLMVKWLESNVPDKQSNSNE